MADALLDAQVMRALALRLSLEWSHLNDSHFRSKMRVPSIEIVDDASMLGSWHPHTRTLRMLKRFVFGEKWGQIIEVLKHEMAHQYVHEVLDVHDETAHGPAFQKVCATLHIDARASGLSVEAGELDDEETRVLQRIAKLLSLAQSSNQHEAEAAMNTAQKLMLKHNLSTLGVPRRTGAHYRFRELGKPKGSTTEADRLVSVILAEHFFVQAIWVSAYVPTESRSGRVLEISGTPANVDMAEYVHEFLHRTAKSMWAEHKRVHGVRSNRESRAFAAGLMQGFLEKLRSERKRNAEAGLVWVKDQALDDYLRARHPHIRHTRHAGERRNEAHAHGRRAGRDLVIRKPVAGPAAAGPRLLGPKR